VPCSQSGAEWYGHREPGLQSDGGAQRRPALHRHPGGFIPTGEVSVDERHLPGTPPPHLWDLGLNMFQTNTQHNSKVPV